MIEYIKREKIAFLTIALFLIAKLIIQFYSTSSVSIKTIVVQMLLLFSMSSIVVHQCNWNILNVQTVSFILINAITPIILMYLAYLLYSKILSIVFINVTGFMDASLVIYKLMYLYCLLLPSLLFLKIHKTQSKINSKSIQTPIVLAFIASAYLLLSTSYVEIFYGMISRVGDSFVSQIYFIVLSIIAFVYLYFWYKPIFEKFGQNKEQPLLMLNVSILVVLTICMIVTTPVSMIVSAFIYLGSNIIGLVLIGVVCICTFTLSSMKYYKIYHTCILISVVIFLYLQGNPINFIYLIIAYLSFLLLFYGLLSRFILKKILIKIK